MIATACLIDLWSEHRASLDLKANRKLVLDMFHPSRQSHRCLEFHHPPRYIAARSIPHGLLRIL